MVNYDVWCIDTIGVKYEKWYLSFFSFITFVDKGGIMSEDTGGFLLLQKHIPNFYPKLFHPIHGND